jgi:diguanylate cyclase (GGDEF)-like protein
MVGTVDTSVMDNVRRLLEGLKKTADGAMMYKLIERALHKFSGTSGQVEVAFVVFLHKLLHNYANLPDNDPVTRMKARVLEQRLVPYLPAIDPGLTPHPVPKPAAPPRPASDSALPTLLTPAGEPASLAATSKKRSPAAPKPAVAVRLAKKSFPTMPPVAEPAPPPRPAADVTPAPASEPVLEPAGAAAEPDTTDGDQDEVDMLQVKVAHNVADIISRNRAFDALLRESLDSLQKSDDQGGVEDLRQVLVQGIEALISGQQDMGEKLFTTTSYLNVIHSDRRKLRDALNSARKHSLTDELTGLPNHVAFARQLDNEIGRAKRYGFSLAVAIIDVDDLKSVNQLYGRAAGDAVLQCYTREIMSQFRGYDVVARFGKDEFAVLFPNTLKEGATRALEKAQKRALETYITHEGKNIPLPSFSSVLTLYSPGERPSTILKRASQALDHAKQRGYNQMVVALPGN